MKNKIESYQAAYSELQTIVNKLQSEDVNIDELAENIKRAKELMDYCKKKLRTTEEDLEKTLKTNEE